MQRCLLYSRISPVKHHKENHERESSERHYRDRDVSVFHKIDELAAHAGRGAGDERIATELEIGMVGTHNKAEARKGKCAISNEISIFAHMLFFSREHGDDEDDGVGIEKSALDPAENAWSEMGEFGIEQASDDAADGDKE